MGITAFPFQSVIDVPTARILGRDDAGTGSAEALTTAEVLGLLSVYTTAQVDSLLSGKSNVGHTHDANAITSGTLDIARIPLGTTSTTVCVGNDARLSDARAPLSHAHGNITNAGAIGTTESLPIITGVSGVLQAGSFGTTAGTFCQGNDARLSDARTPLAHTHTPSDITGFGEAVDDEVATLLTAGTGISLSYNDNANTLTIASTVTPGVGGSTGGVDNAVLRADGTGGATLQTSSIVIADNYTASPNATVNHASIQATGATTNVSVSVVPKGTGSFSLQVPNGATSGGNARGANAVDLQTDRSSAAQVASGQYSFTICYGNTASGTAAFAGGYAVTSSGFGSFAWGNNNTISGQYATGFGQGLTVSATHAFGAGINQSNSHVSAATLGRFSASLSVGGVFFGTSGRYSNPTAGDMHAGLIPLVGFTQGTTAVNLGHGDNGATQLSVPSGSSFGFSVLIHGVRSKGGEAALFHRQGIVKNIGGTTSLTGSIQTIGTDINAGSASIAITADDANDALQIACTQPTGQFTGATGDAGTDVITLTGHPFASGDEICFSSLTGGTGLSTGTRYFVRDVSGNTFKVTTTFVGNTAVNFTTNITDATVDFIWYWHAVLTVNRIDFALY